MRMSPFRCEARLHVNSGRHLGGMSPFRCEARLHVNSGRHLGHPPLGRGSLLKRPRPGVCARHKKWAWINLASWSIPSRVAWGPTLPWRLGTKMVQNNVPGKERGQREVHFTIGCWPRIVENTVPGRRIIKRDVPLYDRSPAQNSRKQYTRETNHKVGMRF